ncbi:MAG: flippase-like domain-containing protein [Flavobacteriales bacterium]|nr:flippase-like domain-containing protein [Flavobacteriales bacterium]
MKPGIDLSKYFSFKRILVPLILGLGVAIYFLYTDGFYRDELNQIHWGQHVLIWIIASVIMMVLRDFGYMWRLRILTDKQLSWRQCFEIIVLWEFASAISPGAIGGTAAAVVIMAQEKIRTGMTTAIVLVTSFLDELFYILMVPILFIFIGTDDLFPTFDGTGFDLIVNTTNLKVLFYGGYAFLFAWTVFLALALFIRPQMVRGILLGILAFRPLRKFRARGRQLANDLLHSSIELKSKGWRFWFKAFFSTGLTWTARFLVVNCLLVAFGVFDDHLVIYARQLIMWVILLIAITPGGSGVAEVLFPSFLGNYLPSRQIARMVSILWRMISYYPYIFLGFIVLPMWARRVNLYQKIRLFKGFRGKEINESDPV